MFHLRTSKTINNYLQQGKRDSHEMFDDNFIGISYPHLATLPCIDTSNSLIINGGSVEL